MARNPSIASVTLNGTPLTADVDYTAEIPEGTEAGTYTVTLTGKGNYTGTATITFSVNPVEQKPLDQKDDNGHELRLEVETGLSTVPTALESDEKYNTPEKIETALRTSGKYTFTMPGRAVTVKAAFAPLPDDTQKPCDGGVDCPSRSFTDLGGVGTWYHEAVDYALRNGLMNGYSNGTFGPNDTLSRAQFAQILFNREGRPVVNYLLQYGDVAKGAWYTEAVRWATSQGIIGGYGNGMFGPNDNITREQLAVMLWRYAGSPAATDKELHFADADKIGTYARNAMRWAVENGVMSGKGDGILDPKGLATRAQASQMLKNYLEGQPE